MKKMKVNYTIDILLLISAFLCSVTGIIKWPGLVLSLGLTYKDIPIAAITSLHDWSGLLICILAVIHILMHRKWIMATTRQIFHHQPGDRSE